MTTFTIDSADHIEHTTGDHNQTQATTSAVSTSLPTWPHDSVCPHSQAMDKRLAIDGDATGFMLPGLAVLHRFW